MTVGEISQDLAHGTAAGDSSGTNWTRKAVANCYFNSPMPALTRRLRDQYHLSISRTAGWPRVSFEKRTEPTARILIYHRVNDDNDPFFPAISTALFEQEMRFIGRHYNVVSLAEVVNVLAGRSSKPVLAITFDDGYQDNYHNALPILRRYELPASIFLTTESMDSRQPLWFEQMAQAVKRTSRDCIDLETDPPRRFWMRTQVERLETIDGIFGVLRDLLDSERRQWLARILRQLGVEDDWERRDKMLTWDQARSMQKWGIDFGGHTVTHPFLSQMPEEQVAWEVSECKRRIEEELQFPVSHFAYPNGREKDFGNWNKDVIRRAGYKAAVTTIWGPNYRSTDLMELRRGGPWETSPAAFAYKLDWYQLVDG
jgi:peptidoglycan/xylan/chitin deacetylase (PgdA/CDA1 family)